MSTASGFAFRGGFFPFCVPHTETPTAPTATMDFVDVDVEDAVNLAWNLEEFEVVTTGTKGASNINWTTTFGPTESLPFTPTSGSNRTGLYYDGDTPAKAPNKRVCEDSTDFRPRILFGSAHVGTGTINVLIELGAYIPSTQKIRLYYVIQFSNGLMIIKNPLNFPLTGTPPSTGNLTVLGIDFPWQGGGYIPGSPGSWDTQTATLSTTSAAFSY